MWIANEHTHGERTVLVNASFCHPDKVGDRKDNAGRLAL